MQQQQAVTAVIHGFELHVTFGVNEPPSAVQMASVVLTHWLVGLAQHAPNTNVMQPELMHDVPTPMNAPPVSRQLH